jgi:4'-phosphopantetheinyl transferase
MMALDRTCPNPAPLPSLDRGEIHIWSARLDLISRTVRSFLLTLSSNERARSERFRFERDRNRYVMARGILRKVVGDYLDVAPASLNFWYGSFGKPFLAPESLPYPIHFSVSHSCGLVLFGFSRDQEIGIDVERIRVNFEFEHMAKAFFPPGEFAELHSLAASGRPAGFFRLWTRLEAYSKGRGTGLSLLDVSGASSPPHADPVRQPARNYFEEISSWAVEHFTPETDYIAAVAARIGGSNLRYWKYPDQIEISDEFLTGRALSICKPVSVDYRREPED